MATFLKSGGATIVDPDGSAPVFEVPISDPTTLQHSTSEARLRPSAGPVTNLCRTLPRVETPRATLRGRRAAERAALLGRGRHGWERHRCGCGAAQRPSRHRRAAVLLAVALFVGAAGVGASTSPAGALDGSIIGGTPVADGGYRFQAALLALPFGNTDRQRQYCGGSLIGPFYVLTAAHCVDFIGLKQLRVVVGRTVLSSTTARSGWRSASPSTLLNPNTMKNDVAVIELVSPITGIQPIKLATTGTDAPSGPAWLATVTGWGNTIRQEPGAGRA